MEWLATIRQLAKEECVWFPLGAGIAMAQVGSPVGPYPSWKLVLRSMDVTLISARSLSSRTQRLGSLVDLGCPLYRLEEVEDLIIPSDEPTPVMEAEDDTGGWGLP